MIELKPTNTDHRLGENAVQHLRRVNRDLIENERRLLIALGWQPENPQTSAEPQEISQEGDAAAEQPSAHASASDDVPPAESAAPGEASPHQDPLAPTE